VNREEREQFFDAAASVSPYIAAETERGTFLVRTDDEAVGRGLFAKTSRGDMSLVRRVVEILRALGQQSELDGKTFLDGGANIGTTTISALLSGAFAGGLAFEPEPRNYRLLRANLVLNDLDRHVRTFPVALSNAVGTAELELHPSNSGGHHVNTSRGRADLAHVTVERTTIDALAEAGQLDPEAIGLVWLDVQGSEGHVLAGATRLTALGTPVVAELYPRMLRRGGGLKLLEAAARQYSHYLDLRTLEDGASVKAALAPAAKLGAWKPAGANGFTDILLVRL
jgi:FkbM family methyltransferase